MATRSPKPLIQIAGRALSGGPFAFDSDACSPGPLTFGFYGLGFRVLPRLAKAASRRMRRRILADSYAAGQRTHGDQQDEDRFLLEYVY